MAIPTNKESLVQEIKKTYAKVLAEFVNIPADKVYEMTVEGQVKDTTMSIHNLLSYLVGWGELVIKWHASKIEEVDFPETGYKWNELSKLAQKFYKDYEGIAYAELVQRFEKVVTDILALIDKHTDAELYGCGWYGNWTMGRMIQFNTSSPYANARGRIRRWKKGN